MKWRGVKKVSLPARADLRPADRPALSEAVAGSQPVASAAAKERGERRQRRSRAAARRRCGRPFAQRLDRDAGELRGELGGADRHRQPGGDEAAVGERVARDVADRGLEPGGLARARSGPRATARPRSPRRAAAAGAGRAREPVTLGSSAMKGSSPRSRRSALLVLAAAARPRPGSRPRRAARPCARPPRARRWSPSDTSALISGRSAVRRASACGTRVASALGNAPTRSSRGMARELVELARGELQPPGDHVGVLEQQLAGGRELGRRARARAAARRPGARAPPPAGRPRAASARAPRRARERAEARDLAEGEHAARVDHWYSL